MTSALDLASFQCIEMAIYDSSNFSGGTTWDLLNGPSSYQYFTGSGFQNDIKILELYNGSNVLIILSFTMITVNVMGLFPRVRRRLSTCKRTMRTPLVMEAEHLTASKGSSFGATRQQAQETYISAGIVEENR